MSRSTTLLLCSLAANIALGAVFWASLANRLETSISTPAAQPVHVSDATLLAALKAGDPARLRDAGLADDVHHHLQLGAALDRLEARLMAIKPGPPPDPRYWRNAAYYRHPFTLEQRRERNAARREFADAVRELTGDELASDPVKDATRAALAPEKRRELARIEQDYDEMIAEITEEGGLLQLPSDREKLRYLDEQKKRDIAAALTPAEREMLEMSESLSALKVRSRFGDIIQNEADYRALYSFHKALDDRFPEYDPQRGILTSPNMNELLVAEVAVAEQIRAALGDEKYAELLKAIDQDRRALKSLGQRAELPAGSAERAIAVRDALALESQRIANDATQPKEQRQAELKSLAERARQELVGVLGPEAGPAYVKYAGWIRYLSEGSGFTMDPKAEPKFNNVFGAGSTPVSVKSE